jgi:hydroxymethylbilane synthase
MRRLEGGCHVPIGAYATLADGAVSLEAVVAAADGRSSVRASHRGSSADPAAVGIALAEELISRGADEILAAIRGGGEGS